MFTRSAVVAVCLAVLVNVARGEEKPKEKDPPQYELVRDYIAKNIRKPSEYLEGKWWKPQQWEWVDNTGTHRGWVVRHKFHLGGSGFSDWVFVVDDKRVYTAKPWHWRDFNEMFPREEL